MGLTVDDAKARPDMVYPDPSPVKKAYTSPTTVDDVTVALVSWMKDASLAVDGAK